VGKEERDVERFVVRVSKAFTERHSIPVQARRQGRTPTSMASEFSLEGRVLGAGAQTEIKGGE